MKLILIYFVIKLFTGLCKQPILFLRDRELSRILRAPIMDEKNYVIGKIDEYNDLLNETIQNFKVNGEEADTLGITIFLYGCPKFAKVEPNMLDIDMLWRLNPTELEVLNSKINTTKLLWNEFISTYRSVKHLDDL